MNRHGSADRIVIWLLVIAAVVAGLIAWTRIGPDNSAVKVALVTADDDPYWNLLIDGAESAADSMNVKLTVMKANGQLDQQNELILNASKSGYDALAVSPMDAHKQGVLLRGVGKDHQLVTVDSDCELSGRICFVGADNYAAGRLCGEMIKQALPDGARVAIVMGPITKENGERRRQGIIDELLDRSYGPGRPVEPLDEPITGGKYELVATLIDDIDPDAAEANVRGAIEADPSINCFVGLYAYSAPAALRAVEAAGVKDRVSVLGFDDREETLAAIEAGDMYSTIAQDQFSYGYAAINILAKAARGQGDVAIPMGEKMHFPPIAVTAENLVEFKQGRQSEGP